VSRATAVDVGLIGLYQTSVLLSGFVAEAAESGESSNRESLPTGLLGKWSSELVQQAHRMVSAEHLKGSGPGAIGEVDLHLEPEPVQVDFPVAIEERAGLGVGQGADGRLHGRKAQLAFYGRARAALNP
jgi:hypothetical protein